MLSKVDSAWKFDEKTREVLESYVGEDGVRVIRKIAEESVVRLQSYGTVTLDIGHLNDKEICDVDDCDCGVILDFIRDMMIDELKGMSEFSRVFYLEDIGSSYVFALNRETLMTAVKLRVDKILSTDIPEEELNMPSDFYYIMLFEEDIRSSVERLSPPDEYDKIMYLGYGVAKGYVDSDDEDVLNEAISIKAYLDNGGYARYKAAFDYINKLLEYSAMSFDNMRSFKDLVDAARVALIEEEAAFIKCIDL